MSKFSGNVGEGARKILKDRRRQEAQARQEAYDTEVLELAKRQNISLREARHILRSTRNLDYKKRSRSE